MLFGDSLCSGLSTLQFGTTGVPGTETVPNYGLLILLMRVMHMDNGNTTYLLLLRLLGGRAKRPITLACITTA